MSWGLSAAQAREEQRKWSELLVSVCSNAVGLILGRAKQLQTIDKQITAYTQKNEDCRKLMTIPYVGPITAAALSAVMFRPENFKNARQFASYAYFAPAHTGTGGRIVMLGLPKKGNPWLKRVLYRACLSLYNRHHQAALPDGQEAWLQRLARRKTVKQTVCATANKICRIAWALLRNRTEYTSDQGTLKIKGLKAKKINTRLSATKEWLN